MDDNIAGRAIGKATTQTMTADAESSQIRAGRMVPTDSHQKRLTEQEQFRASYSTRRRAVRSVEQYRDGVEAVHAQDVQDPAVETNATYVADKVADDVVQPDALVADDVVHPDGYC